MLPFLFFSFICWIIYEADLGANNVFLTFVRTIPFGDKLGHVGLYGLLVALINWAAHCRLVRVQRFRLQIGTLMVLIFSLSEELTQGGVPTRTLDVTDAVADIIGIAIAAYLSRRFYVWHQRRVSLVRR
jgi:VanZ family protein